MNIAIGFAVGALIGIMSYLLLRGLAGKSDNPSTAAMLRKVAWLELVSLPIFGALIGGLAFGN